MTQQPIENYGIVGDMHAVALVGMNGSVDWLCYPHFDSPSVFAAILDDDKGGRFRISPTCDGLTHKQFYWPDTNVLVSRFLSADGVGEVTDFMPVESGGRRGRGQLVRRVSVVRGTIRFRMECLPAFNYARDEHETRIDAQGASFHSPGLRLALLSPAPLAHYDTGVTSEFVLHEGEQAAFLLHELCDSGPADAAPVGADVEELFQLTVSFWRRWIAQSSYTGRWREMVQRSALALKLLTYQPSGAIVAAPTCSLPEGLGGERN